jgi:hypothetical protein
MRQIREGRHILAEKRVRQSPKPKPTVHAIFLQMGRQLGAMEAMTLLVRHSDDAVSTAVLHRFYALRDAVLEASRWSQRESLEQLRPQMAEVEQVFQAMLREAKLLSDELFAAMRGEDLAPRAERRLETQVQELLPPDVQF